MHLRGLGKGQTVPNFVELDAELLLLRYGIYPTFYQSD